MPQSPQNLDSLTRILYFEIPDVFRRRASNYAILVSNQQDCYFHLTCSSSVAYCSHARTHTVVCFVGVFRFTVHRQLMSMSAMSVQASAKSDPQPSVCNLQRMQAPQNIRKRPLRVGESVTLVVNSKRSTVPRRTVPSRGSAWGL